MTDLARYSSFETSTLGTALNEAVNNDATRRMLAARELAWVVGRYGNVASVNIVVWAEQSADVSGRPMRFAAIEDGHLLAAGICRPRGTLSAANHRYGVLENMDYVSAWTAGDMSTPETGERLTEAYDQIATAASQRQAESEASSWIWTAEPIESPQFVHQAIARAGFRHYATDELGLFPEGYRIDGLYPDGTMMVIYTRDMPIQTELSESA